MMNTLGKVTISVTPGVECQVLGVTLNLHELIRCQDQDQVFGVRIKMLLVLSVSVKCNT